MDEQRCRPNHRAHGRPQRQPCGPQKTESPVRGHCLRPRYGLGAARHAVGAHSGNVAPGKDSRDRGRHADQRPPVGQLENEVEKKQTLIDEHILAKDPAEMASLDARLAMLERQIALTTQSYEPWATLPGERTTGD